MNHYFFHTISILGGDDEKLDPGIRSRPNVYGVVILLYELITALLGRVAVYVPI